MIRIMIRQRLAEKNWTQDRDSPSTRAEKWSITRIWPEKHTAHSRTSKSPRLTETASVTHRKYSPATASITPSQTRPGTGFRRSRPKTGTSTMYSAVIKPALPEVVVSSPFCWK